MIQQSQVFTYCFPLSRSIWHFTNCFHRPARSHGSDSVFTIAPFSFTVTNTLLIVYLTSTPGRGILQYYGALAATKFRPTADQAYQELRSGDAPTATRSCYSPPLLQAPSRRHSVKLSPNTFSALSCSIPQPPPFHFTRTPLKSQAVNQKGCDVGLGFEKKGFDGSIVLSLGYTPKVETRF